MNETKFPRVGTGKVGTKICASRFQTLSPTFILRQDGESDQLFFGQDRIELLCAALKKEYFGPASAWKK